VADVNPHSRDYANKFYEHHQQNQACLLEAIIRGSKAFTDIMAEATGRDLGKDIGVEVLTVAIACIPGGKFLDEAWQLTKSANKLYGASVEFWAARGVDVGKSILKLKAATGTAIGRPYASTLSSMMEEVLHPIYQRLDDARVRLQAEKDVFLDETLYSLNTPAAMKAMGAKDAVDAVQKMLGEIPPVNRSWQVDALVLNVMAHLFKRYCKFKPVEIEGTRDFGVWEIVSGFNGPQGDFVTTRFQKLDERIGSIKSVKDLQKWDAVARQYIPPRPMNQD
jgi:hypothetical protein